MKKQLWMTVPVSVIALIVAGCSGSAPPESEAGSAEAQAAAQAAHAAEADTEMTVEVGCAMCIYEQEGATTCTTAAKVGDTVYLVEGGGLDAHEAGLCTAAKQATVMGHIHGDRLMASSITVQ